MAKKELLFFLVLNSLLQLATIGSACGNSNKGEWLRKEENMIWAQDLAGRSKKITMSSIMDKYKELIKMQEAKNLAETDNLTDIDALTNLGNDTGTLKVFVSHSMGVSLLKNYVKAARKYGATLVFNGLPDNSWQALSRLVAEIATEGEEVAIQIDPEEFDRFNIKSVPSFILVKENDWLTNGDLENIESKAIYDKVVGNIGISSALRLFAEDGELAELAKGKIRGEIND